MNNNLGFEHIQYFLEGKILNESTYLTRVCCLFIVILRMVIAYEYSIFVNPISVFDTNFIFLRTFFLIADLVLFLLISWVCQQTRYFIILHFIISALIIYICKDEMILFSLITYIHYFVYSKYKIAIYILDCSEINKNLILEYMRDLLVIQPYIFRLIVNPSLTMNSLLYILTIIISSVHYIYLNLAQQSQTKNKIQKQTYQIFFAHAIINPPWINLNTYFIDKNQYFYQRFVKYNLIYKIIQAIIICQGQKLYFQLQNEKLIKYHNVTFFLIDLTLAALYCAIAFYTVSLIKLLIINTDNKRQQNVTYYQLMYKKYSGDIKELKFLKKWISSQYHKRIHRDDFQNFNFIQLLFKPDNVSDFNSFMVIENHQKDFNLIGRSTVEIKSIGPDKLLINTLIIIYNLMRFREDQGLHDLPNLEHPQQVNNYLRRLKVVMKDIFPNNQFKRIVFENDQQLDYSSVEVIFFLKFLDSIFESPLIQLISQDRQLQNVFHNRYIENLQQFFNIIYLKRLQQQLPISIQIISCDLFEEFLL